MTFNGFGGHPVKGRLTIPARTTTPLPVVVQFIGYGGGRGLPHMHLLWPAAGRAHFVMDTRGQGARMAGGDTPDPVGSAPSYPGFMTRGIESPHDYYYRRVFTDAVRAVEAARSRPAAPTASPMAIAVHRTRATQVHETLSYFDGVHFAARAKAPALFSTALEDQVAPPSTVFAAFNAWSHPDKQINVYGFNAHEGGGPHQEAAALRRLTAGPAGRGRVC